MQKTKSEIRSFIRGLSRPSEQEADAVRMTIEGLESFKMAHTVLIYWSIGNELPTQDMIQKWSGTKRIILPRVEGNSLVLAVYEGSDSLRKGSFGIMEPVIDSETLSPEDIDLAIIPGVAFDTQCHRLGHGKAYYDRLLPELHCPVIGIAQQLQIVDEVPVEPHDKGVDIVITPLNCYFCKI